MLHVFISYSNEDKNNKNRKYIKQILALLQANRVPYWFAPEREKQVSDEEFAHGLVEALEHSAALILLFSRAASQSPYVKKEIAVAVKLNLPIIVIRLEDIQPGGAWFYNLSNLDWLELWQLSTSDWHNRLLQRIRKYLPPSITFPIDSTPDRNLKVEISYATIHWLFGSSQTVQLLGAAIVVSGFKAAFFQNPTLTLNVLGDLKDCCASGVILNRSAPFGLLPFTVREDILLLVGFAPVTDQQACRDCQAHIQQLLETAGLGATPLIRLQTASAQISLPPAGHSRKLAVARFLTELIRQAKTGHELVAGSCQTTRSNCAPALPPDQELGYCLEQVCCRHHQSRWRLPRHIQLAAAAEYIKSLVGSPS